MNDPTNQTNHASRYEQHIQAASSAAATTIVFVMVILRNMPEHLISHEVIKQIVVPSVTVPVVNHRLPPSH